MNETDILFLGGFFPRHIEEEIIKKSKGPIQVAANTFQWELIDGIEGILKRPIKLLSFMFVGSYPRGYKDIIIRGFKFNHKKGSEDFSIGFFNLAAIKQFLLAKVLRKPIKKWLLNNRNKKKVIIMYSVQHAFMKIAEFIKKIDPNVHICITVNDLPAYMSMSKDKYFLYRLIKKRNIRSFENNIKFINSFVLVTKQMKEYLKINDKPYVVVEGIINDSNIHNYQKVPELDNIKTILYTGTLTKKYGVLDLISAFKLIKNDNYRLVICGDGETKLEIMEKIKIDNRITFKGLISRENVLKLQQMATVLVNPRRGIEEYTKYSFPWKIIEYMMSGTPIVCYKLPGVPDEYDKYLMYVDGNSIESLAEKIDEVCSLSYKKRKIIGEHNMKFIFENKNSVAQAGKILKMVLN